MAAQGHRRGGDRRTDERVLRQIQVAGYGGEPAVFSFVSDCADGVLSFWEQSAVADGRRGPDDFALHCMASREAAQVFFSRRWRGPIQVGFQHSAFADLCHPGRGRTGARSGGRVSSGGCCRRSELA